MVGHNVESVKTTNPTQCKFVITQIINGEERPIKINPEKIMNLLSSGEKDFYVEGSSFYVPSNFFTDIRPSNKLKPVKKLKDLSEPVSVTIMIGNQTVNPYSTTNFFLVTGRPCFLDSDKKVHVSKYAFSS